MRAVYVAAIVFLLANVVIIQRGVHHRNVQALTAHVLLVQNIPGSPNGATRSQPSSAEKSQAQADKNSATQPQHEQNAQPADPNASSTMPWLGAPPQFRRTWPPSALPQSDDQNGAGNDDLLLLIAPHKPPKLHKA